MRASRVWGPLVVLVLATAAVAGSVPSEALPPPHRPNFVVIMTDDQHVDSMRFMPHVQALLAARGTTFANSYASYPLCCPSRATFLTGQYAHNHRVLWNHPPTGGYDALDHSRTMPVALRRAGYETVHVGRYLNGYGSVDPLEVPPGWTHWWAPPGVNAYRYFDFAVNHNGSLIEFLGTADYQTDVLAGIAEDYIRSRAPQDPPFLLSVMTLAPHSRTGPARGPSGANPEPAPRHRGSLASETPPRPPSFNERNVDDKPAHIRRLPRFAKHEVQRRAVHYRDRLESLLAVDEAVYRVVRALDESGQLDDTYVLFTSDNGYLQGEHRVPSGKYFPYEESARVPLIVRGPGVAAGQVLSQLVANVDIAPTFTDLAGAQPLAVMDGRSLRPLFADPYRAWRRHLLLESGPNPKWPSYTAIRGSRYLYTRLSTGESELYRMDTDPYQRSSLHADPAYRRRAADLSARLARLSGCAGQTCRDAE